MGARTSYAAGTPCWADVQAPDVGAAATFYSGLFGWSAQDLGEEAGHYTMFQLDGRDVAAAGPLQAEGMPPVWTTYLASDDVDATAKLASESGGTVLAEPFDVFTSGRMAIIMDPVGAVFGVWQARDHIGAQHVNDPNTMSWNELTTKEPDRALDFYSKLFGWKINKVDMPGPDGGTATYREIHLGDRVVGGCIEMDDQWEGIPAHWMVYFSVDDADASAAKVTQLGGNVQVPPTDIPPGRFAVVSDPGGAHFTIIKLSGPPQD